MVMVLCVAASAVGVSCSKFDELVQPSWATDHIIYEGELLKLKLDNSSGTFRSILCFFPDLLACLQLAETMPRWWLFL